MTGGSGSIWSTSTQHRYDLARLTIELCVGDMETKVAGSSSDLNCSDLTSIGNLYMGQKFPVIIMNNLPGIPVNIFTLACEEATTSLLALDISEMHETSDVESIAMSDQSIDNSTTYVGGTREYAT